MSSVREPSLIGESVPVNRRARAVGLEFTVFCLLR
jgi:hypothetical protein